MNSWPFSCWPLRTHAGRARPPRTWLSRLVIRDGAEVHVVSIDTVDVIEAQDDYVAIRTAGRTLLKEQTMSELERQLDPRRFVRIHRSFLLTLDRLVRLESTGSTRGWRCCATGGACP